MADLVSQSGTRVQAPDHLVKFLKTRGFREAVPAASLPVVPEEPAPTPKPRRTRKTSASD